MRTGSFIVFLFGIGSAIVTYNLRNKPDQDKNRDEVRVWFFGTIFFWILFALMQAFPIFGSAYD